MNLNRNQSWLTINTLLMELKTNPTKSFEQLVNQIDHETVNESMALKILQHSKDSIEANQQNTFKELWNKLKEKKCDFQANHYVVAMQFYQRIKETDEVMSIFEEFEGAGFKPTP